MSCDIRLASENAVFGQPETGLGITPGFGGTQRLARIIPVGKAKEMLYEMCIRDRLFSHPLRRPKVLLATAPAIWSVF